MMSMCRVFSYVAGRECLLWPVCSLGKALSCFTLYSKAKFACYSRCFLTSYFSIPVPYNEKGTFWGVSSKRSCRSSVIINVCLRHILSRSQSVSSVTQSCLTLSNPIYCSTPGFPVHPQLPEFTQTHLHWVGDAIQPSHPLSSPSPPTFNLSQHQGLFKWVSSLHQVAKVLEFQLQHHSFQWTPRTDLL